MFSWLHAGEQSKCLPAFLISLEIVSLHVSTASRRADRAFQRAPSVSTQSVTRRCGCNMHRSGRAAEGSWSIAPAPFPLSPCPCSFLCPITSLQHTTYTTATPLFRRVVFTWPVSARSTTAHTTDMFELCSTVPRFAPSTSHDIRGTPK